MNFRNTISAGLGKAIGRGLRLCGYHASTLPGLIIEKVDPNFLKRILQDLPLGVAVISGTNGKTTTTKMVVELLEKNGLRVFTNDSGSNWARGVASSASQKMRRGRLDFDIAVLELDEAHAVKFVHQVKPNFALLLNVLRDQLDRFGEIDTTARMLAEIAKNTTQKVILNADDPHVARDEKIAKSPIAWFGFSSNLTNIFPTDEQLHYRSSAKKNPTIESRSDEITLTNFSENDLAEYSLDGHKVPIHLSTSGAHNALNGAAALMLTRTILVAGARRFDLTKNANWLAQVKPAFGRGENIVVGDRMVALNLVKNPAGFQSVLRSADATRPTLFLVNDHYADGRDISWLYDVDFIKFAQTPTVFAGGIRAFDIALRLKYDSVRVCEIEPDIGKVLARFLTANSSDRLQVFATYTAMLDARKVLRNYKPQRVGK